MTSALMRNVLIVIAGSITYSNIAKNGYLPSNNFIIKDNV